MLSQIMHDTQVGGITISLFLVAATSCTVQSDIKKHFSTSYYTFHVNFYFCNQYTQHERLHYLSQNMKMILTVCYTPQKLNDQSSTNIFQ